MTGSVYLHAIWDGDESGRRRRSVKDHASSGTCVDQAISAARFLRLVTDHGPSGACTARTITGPRGLGSLPDSSLYGHPVLATSLFNALVSFSPPPPPFFADISSTSSHLGAIKHSKQCPIIKKSLMNFQICDCSLHTDLVLRRGRYKMRHRSIHHCHDDEKRMI